MDKQIFEERTCALWPSLVRTARCIVRDTGDAEDAAAQAVLSCYQALPRLRNEAAFEAWMMRACINESRRILRRRGRVELRDDLSTLNIPAREKEATLSDWLSLLPERDRLPLHLMYACDMTLDQIAAALGVPHGTAASRICRARKRLRTILEKEGL